MARNTQIRKCSINASVMEYPYDCIEDECCGYTIKDIQRPILVDEELADAGDFPKNIAEHFWVSEGNNDTAPWHSIGVLTNGNYFYYTASCDYTGFDCQGEMRLFVSSSYANLIEHALDQEVYRKYLAETAAFN